MRKDVRPDHQQRHFCRLPIGRHKCSGWNKGGGAAAGRGATPAHRDRRGGGAASRGSPPISRSPTRRSSLRAGDRDRSACARHGGTDGAGARDHMERPERHGLAQPAETDARACRHGADERGRRRRSGSGRWRAAPRSGSSRCSSVSVCRSRAQGTRHKPDVTGRLLCRRHKQRHTQPKTKRFPHFCLLCTFVAHAA